jgi:hypothetical protein
MAEVIREQHPDRASANESAAVVVMRFNDHDDTDWPDVKALLDETSLRWDETHGGAA